MKLFLRAVIFASLTGLSLFADEIGTDQTYGQPENGIMSLNEQDQRSIRALSSFATALLMANRAESFDLLLDALENDPKSNFLPQLVLRTLKKPANLKKALPRLVSIARKNPDALTVNFLVLSLDRKAKIESRIELAENCIEHVNPEKLSGKHLDIYCSIVRILSALYLDNKQFEKGDEFFDDLMHFDNLSKNSSILESATLFYSNAASKASKDRRLLGILPSLRDNYKEKQQEYLECLNKIKLDFKNPKKLFSRVAFFNKLGMNDKAEAVLIDFLVETPRQLQGWILLAELYGKNKKYDMEVKVWRSIIKNFKTNPVYYKRLGDAALKAGLNDSAAEALNWYLIANPKDIGAVFMLSMVYIKTGKPEDALKKLNILPALPGILRLKATALGQMRKYQQGLLLMKKIEASQAGRKDQKILNKFFYSYMMYLAEKSRDVKTVLNCAETMLKKFGDDDPHIANAVGYIYADMNIKLDEAEKLIKKSLKAEPDKVETLDSLAWVLYRKKQFGEAEKVMQRVLTLQGGYPHAVIADHAGDIYAAMGQMDKALKCWRLAIKIYSKDLNTEEVNVKIRKAEQALRGKVKNG